MMFKDNYHNRVSKFIATQKPNKVKVDEDAEAATAAKANIRKLLCDCPGSEPGKINLDIFAHLPGCHIRKRLQTGRFTINTSVTPAKFNDGCSLGVVLGEEYY
jgi:hypothetical protein